MSRIMWDWSANVDQRVPDDPMHWGVVQQHSDVDAVPALVGLHMVVKTVINKADSEVNMAGSWPWHLLSTPAWGGLGTGTILMLVAIAICIWRFCCRQTLHHHGAGHNQFKLRPIFKGKEFPDMRGYMADLAKVDWLAQLKQEKASGNLVDLHAPDAPPPGYEHVSTAEVPVKI